jgi:hypothetical protein
MEKCFKGADIYYILAAIPWVKELAVLDLNAHIEACGDPPSPYIPTLK